MFSGHEHRNGVTKIANTDGKEIPRHLPGHEGWRCRRALFTYNKATKTYTVEASKRSHDRPRGPHHEAAL